MENVFLDSRIYINLLMTFIRNVTSGELSAKQATTKDFLLCITNMLLFKPLLNAVTHETEAFVLRNQFFVCLNASVKGL
jgi:hypothetical protein